MLYTRFDNNPFRQWSELIEDLQILYKGSKFKQGNLAAIPLALCYLEALGKIYFYKQDTVMLGPTSVFCKTLKLFGIRKVDAQKIYDFRSEIVHAGPDLKTIVIVDKKTGVSTEIDIEWYIKTLGQLLNLIRERKGGWTMIQLAQAIGSRKE